MAEGEAQSIWRVASAGARNSEAGAPSLPTSSSPCGPCCLPLSRARGLGSAPRQATGPDGFFTFFCFYCTSSLLLLPVIANFFFCLIIFIYLLLFFGCVGSSLRRGLSLVEARGGCFSLRCAGFSLWWLLLLQSTGSRRVSFSSCGTRAQ